MLLNVDCYDSKIVLWTKFTKCPRKRLDERDPELGSAVDHRTYLGYIAEEVWEVMPEICRYGYELDGNDQMTNQVPTYVDIGKISIYLIEELKKSNGRILELEQEVALLKQ